MNIFDAYVSDRPSCFYKIDESGTSFPNLTGDSRALTSSVSSDKSANTPIVRGSSGPVLAGGNKTLKIPTDRLTPKTKNSPVSFECWAVPRLVGPPTEQITSVTNLVTNPSGRNTSGTVVVRENLVPNPRLTVDATGWLPYGAPSYGISTDDSHSGTQSYRVVTDDNTIGQGAWTVVNRPASGGWNIGDVIHASMWVKAPAGTPLVFGLRAPTNLGAGLSPVSFVGTGNWQLVSTSYTVAFSAEVDDVATDLAYLNPQVTTRSPLPAVGTTIYLDDALLEINTSGEVFAGSDVASGDFTYGWSAAANGSSSRQFAPAPVGLVKVNNSSVVWSGADESVHALSKSASATVGFSTVTKMPVSSGKLTLIATVESAGSATIGAWGYNDADAFVSLPYTPVVGPGTFRAVIDLPTQVKTVRMVVTGHSISTSSLGEEIKVSKLMMVDGDYAGPFFDGSTSQTNNARYVWNGTPDASTSTSYAPGPVEIMSHEGTGDGLIFDGDFIKFSVNFANAEPAEVKWQVPDKLSAYQLVGVYNGQKLSLYVNGLIVDEVDLTAEQMLDSLDTVSEEAVVIGSSDTYEILLVDAPAIFDHALSADQVAQHYLAGTDVRDAIDNIMSFGGKAFTFDDNDRNILYTQQFDLTVGLFVDTNSQDGIRPAFDEDGLSRAGTWTGSIPISLTGSTNLAGVKLDWNGDGYYTVETSLDAGDSWTEVQNGELIPETEGLDTTDKEIDVRITFGGGIEDDISVIRNIYAVAYEDYVIRSDNSNRTVTAGEGSVTATLVSSPVQSYQNAGLSMPGTTATIDGGEITQTIELWIKFEDDTAGNILPGLSWDGTDFTATGATLYMNGGTDPVAPVVGEWVHLMLILDDPTSDDIQLGSEVNIQIGLLGVYESGLSADQVARLYASYFGAPVTTVVESGDLSVHEVSTPYHLYDYNWQIVSGGR